MGLFFNYDKPGPGVDKNAPKKKGIFRYFEIFGRKLGKLIQLNMLYFLTSLPMILLCFLFFVPVVAGLFSFANMSQSGISMDDIVTIQSLFSLFLTFLFVLFIGSGPASCASSYIMRSFVREQHVWLISDFFAKFKENFKQGLLVSIIGLAVTFAGLFSVSFYYQQFITTNQTIWFILMILMVIFFTIFTLMHSYIYQIMVTFENKLGQLYKNALLMTLSSFPQLILISIFVIIVSYLLYTSLMPFASILLSFLLAFTYLRFPFEFYTASSIQKKILDNLPIEENQETDTNDFNRSEN